MEHGLEGYVMDKANAEGIAGAVLEISRDKELAGRLAAVGAAFSRTRFKRCIVNRLRIKNDR
jgi:transposase-like protein